MQRSITPGLYLLTAACGVIDATTFLALGEVFAEIMTGNLMFLAFSIGQGRAVEAIPVYVVPLIAFALGALGGGAVLRGTWIRGHHRTGYVVIAALVATSCALAFAWDPAPATGNAMVIVALLSFAMGVQNALVLFHAVPDIATNVMTLTMVRLLSSWSIIGGTNERWKYRLSSLAVFFVAAMAGAAVVRISPGASLLLATAIYVVAMPWLLTGHKREPASGATASG